MPIADNREDGGKLVCAAMIYAYVKRGLAEHMEMTSWQELEEGDREVMRIAWDEIAAPYTKEITTLLQRVEQAEATIRNLGEYVEELQVALEYSYMRPEG